MKRGKTFVVLAALWAVCLCVFLQPMQASADTHTFKVISGAWGTATNWNPGSLPVNGDNATIGTSTYSTRAIRTANYNYDGSSITLDTVTIQGYSSSYQGTLNIQSGTLKTGTLTINNNGNLNLSGGTLTTTNAINHTSGTFNQTGGTLDANFRLNGGTVGTGTLSIINGKSFQYDKGTFNGRLKLNSGSSATFTNDFTAGNGIENSTDLTFGSNRTLYLNGAGLNNLGTITAQSGTLTLNASGGTGGVTNNGIFDVASGATMFITGGGTPFESTFKNYVSTSPTTGTLTGGTYNVKGTLRIPVQSTPDYHYVTANQATIILDGSGAKIWRTGSNTNALERLTTNDTAGVLTLKNGQAFSESYANFTNKGTLNVIGSGSSFTASGKNYTQTAGLTNLAGGTLNASNVDIQGGILQGAGTINAPVTVSGSTTSINPGNSPGILNINGNYNQTAGIINIELKNTSEYDQINISGIANITGGDLYLHLVPGYSITDFVDSFTLMTFAEGSDVSGLSLHDVFGTDTQGRELHFQFVVTPTSIIANAVPIPPAVWLLGFGLVGLIGIRRRFA